MLAKALKLVKAINNAYLAIEVATAIAASLIPYIGQKFEINVLIEAIARKLNTVFIKTILAG